MEKESNDSLMHRLLESFNSASAYYGTDMDSMMADIAIDIISLFDTTSMRSLTFFDKGKLLLEDDKNSSLSESTRENVEACMFWWVFNEEILENEVRYLIEKSKKP